MQSLIVILFYLIFCTSLEEIYSVLVDERLHRYRDCYGSTFNISTVSTVEKNSYDNVAKNYDHTKHYEYVCCKLGVLSTKVRSLLCSIRGGKSTKSLTESKHYNLLLLKSFMCLICK